jgi:hypothetical protein
VGLGDNRAECPRGHTINGATRATLGVEETATVVGCSPNYIRNLIRAGKLPHSRLPSVSSNDRRGRIVVAVDAIKALIAASEVQP